MVRAFNVGAVVGESRKLQAAYVPGGGTLSAEGDGFADGSGCLECDHAVDLSTGMPFFQIYPGR